MSVTVPLTPIDADKFRERGFAGPVAMLSTDWCRGFIEAIGVPDPPAPLDWAKGHAVTNPLYLEAAGSAAIVDAVAALIGDDILLWGATVLQREPGCIHPWHSDIETCAPDAKAVSVWVGLMNTSSESSLRLIEGSHRLNVTVQQVRHEQGVGRDQATDDDVLAWARRCDARCRLVQPQVSDGQALLFDGRLWHGSHNRADKLRVALLLQYATPDTPIRMPDQRDFNYPFRLLDQPRPPCVLIRGRDRVGVNRVVTPTAGVRAVSGG